MAVEGGLSHSRSFPEDKGFASPSGREFLVSSKGWACNAAITASCPLLPSSNVFLRLICVF